MAGIDIAKKVAAGLANASKAVGGTGGTVEIKRLLGDATANPWEPVAPLETWVELKDCIFKTVNIDQVSGGLIQLGDIEFTSTATEAVNVGDVLRREGVDYTVKTVSVVAPRDIVLLYKGTARAM